MGRSYASPYKPIQRLRRVINERSNIPLKPMLISSRVTFDSNFESGNLDAAIEVSPNEYDLFIRVDTNSKGHNNWFYF